MRRRRKIILVSKSSFSCSKSLAEAVTFLLIHIHIQGSPDPWPWSRLLAKIPPACLFRESFGIQQACGPHPSQVEGHQQAETVAGDGILHGQVKVAAVSSAGVMCGYRAPVSWA